jgi:tetratricopeptide (TPR) repeat protein
VFEFQDRIATSIVGSLEPRVQAVEAARVGDRPTESLDAYNCVLKALSRLYLFTPESYREAGELFERAIVLDPSYAQAHAYVAWWLNFQIGEGRSTDPEADKVRALAIARRALELDPEDSFALAVAGHLLAFLAHKPEDAEGLFEQALALNQNSAFAWGSVLTCVPRATGRSVGAPTERLATESVRSAELLLLGGGRHRGVRGGTLRRGHRVAAQVEAREPPVRRVPADARCVPGVIGRRGGCARSRRRTACRRSRVSSVEIYLVVSAAEA